MSDDFKDEVTEVQLDPPLVVHKKTDASYYDGGINVDMNETHIEEEKKPTIERHRFKKDPDKKSSKFPVILLIIVILAIAIIIILIIIVVILVAWYWSTYY